MILGPNTEAFEAALTRALEKCATANAIRAMILKVGEEKLREDRPELFSELY
jgi:hypothetical protein